MHAHVVLYWEGQFGCFKAQRLAILAILDVEIWFLMHKEVF